LEREPQFTAATVSSQWNREKMQAVVLLRLAPRIIIMKTLIVWILWCVLFVLCWPMALLLLALIPIVWLIALPFRVVGITVGAVFALIRAILYLPARLLGGQKRI
jgi:hypothetical protein